MPQPVTSVTGFAMTWVFARGAVLSAENITTVYSLPQEVFSVNASFALFFCFLSCYNKLIAGKEGEKHGLSDGECGADGGFRPGIRCEAASGQCSGLSGRPGHGQDRFYPGPGPGPGLHRPGHKPYLYHSQRIPGEYSPVSLRYVPAGQLRCPL